MKNLILGLFFLFSVSVSVSFGQLNMELVGQLPYNVDLNDIWGWADPDDGTEYAIVGVFNGVSIVSLADPSNPTEVVFIPGQNSMWRDIKTWGEYAYVVTDQPGTTEGLTVIDLSDLPNSAPFFHWNPDVGGTIQNCHNIYIDEFGYAYLAGCNVNGGAMVIVDVFSDPGNPQWVVNAPGNQSHDVYARDNIMYSSEIFAGQLAIFDISDKQNITLLAQQETPFTFTHNAWLNDAGDVVFTTDEVANAPVAAYDISDLDDIVELDQFVPIATMGQEVIPHNVHVWDDWLLISYYTDGGIVVDASNPDNLIEVGNYDTFLGGNGNFFGAWGLYPFLPSGLVLVSDINSGLYVLEPNLVRACWLEGKVTAADTGSPIFNATINIDSPQANFATTDLVGEYKTGQAIPGTFNVTFEANGYISKTVPAELENGVLTILDVELEVAVPFSASGQTIKEVDGTTLGNVDVRIFNNNFSYQGVSDGGGNFSVAAISEGTYTVQAFSWGYLHLNTTIQVQEGTTIVLELERGYQDDFAVDLGWTDIDNANSGEWEWGDPNGTTYQGTFSNPGADVTDDIGNLCYVTGNGGGGAGNDDVDNGNVVLISPNIDLTDFNVPVLTFDYWFFNDGGNGGPPNDDLEVRISNGIEEVTIFSVTESDPQWLESPEFEITNFIDLTSNMNVIFDASDDDNAAQHLVEAAIDAFLIRETSTYPPFQVNTTTACAPSTIEFSDQSDSTATWSWTFEGGNPATSNEQSPSVTFNNAGIFDVSLTVTTEGGNTYTIDRPDFIQVLGLPGADFSFNQNVNIVDFTNNSTSSDSFIWDFGDNSISQEANPSYEYTETGTYLVTLTATNDCGTTEFTQEVEVTAVPPTAEFSINQTFGCVPFTVEFSDNSAGSPDGWLWEFPGGAPETSTEQNVTVTYNTPGVYSVGLTVTNAAGTSNSIQSQVINVGELPTVDFDYELEDGTIVLINQSENANNYLWDFGDNTSSTEVNPEHTYSENGEYTITLTALNDCGQIVFAQSVFVVISTNVEELAKTIDFNVFPNPFNDRVQVNLSSQNLLEQADLIIYNNLGQVIERKAFSGNSLEIGLGQNYSSGIYIFEIRVEEQGILREKVIKQ